MTRFFLKPLEFIINQYLRLDQEIFPRFKGLAGKTVNFTITDFPMYLTVQFTPQGIEFCEYDECQVDATISGSSFALLNVIRLATASDSATILGEDISVKGDLELVQDIKDIATSLDIDWEEQLSYFTGDIIAHHLGNQLRQVKRWFSHSQQSIEDNISEYLQEELCLLPPREELAYFLADVDLLRMDIDRCEARLNRLQQTLHHDY